MFKENDNYPVEESFDADADQPLAREGRFVDTANADLTGDDPDLPSKDYTRAEDIAMQRYRERVIPQVGPMLMELLSHDYDPTRHLRSSRNNTTGTAKKAHRGRGLK